MAQKDQDLRIDYVEIPAKDIEAAKKFYGQVFGWTFKDHGPEYASFNDGRTRGGITRGASPAAGGVLLVIYAVDLGATQKKIVAAGGVVTKETFDFPGGRRFHFSDPSGTQLAVWSEK